MEPVRIATRKSPLAMWQAEHVAAALRAAHPGLSVTLLPMTSRGDQSLDRPLAEIGGKGLFLKELETALLEGAADLAVHSLKDVPAAMPPGLELAGVSARENPHDALVGGAGAVSTLAALPAGARIGTCSLRRQAQLLAFNPGLRVLPLRGNVNTRLARLDAGDFDAIVLAAAGLVRLGLQARIRQAIPLEECLPAIGQGVMAFETRAGDSAVQARLAAITDTDTAVCAAAERALGARLEASCQVPLAGHAELQPAGGLRLRALVAAPDGSRLVRDEIAGAATDAATLGEALAERLLARGAAEILAALRE